MRIWIVNHYAQMPSELGITRHYALSQPLVERGHEVTIITSGFYHPTRTNLLKPGEAFRLQSAEGVTFLRVRTPAYRDNGVARMINIMGFGWEVRHNPAVRALPRPDVIVGSVPHPFASWAAERWARAYRVPFIMEVRDFWLDYQVASEAVSAHHPAIVFMNHLENGLYRRAQRIISVLPAGYEFLAPLGISRDKVVWIPNGVDLSMVPPPGPAPATDRLQVVFAGAHGMLNGLDTVLAAARILQDQEENRLCFKLIGDGPEKPRLQERARELGLQNLHFLKPVSKAEVYGVLSQAHIGLIHLKKLRTFRYGISPNKLFDYMAVARPVVCAVTTTDDPVSLAGAGLTVDSEDPAAMAAALRRLADLSPEERWEMGLRGRRYVEEHHSSAQLSLQFEKALTQAVAQGH
jgi:glycosyltransferase involved in cell wall biosynthesis